jgi:hypothetical protein
VACGAQATQVPVPVVTDFRAAAYAAIDAA